MGMDGSPFRLVFLRELGLIAALSADDASFFDGRLMVRLVVKLASNQGNPRQSTLSQRALVL